ncbi:hypothetical protein DL765_011249 [Monosporascus sp. GIB2]|nr:hypothetical protein DL765_011249 [Monosporascus sp. GIB2]
MDHFPPPPATQGYSLRKANKADLDDITQIHISGFVEEPMDNYCYPFRFKYRKDHFKWTRKEYEYYLDNSQKYLVHVAEAAEQPEGDRGLDQRKDANKKHVEAYLKVASNRYEPHGFFFKWAEKQINLSVLTVLPEFRRQGVGAMMVNWGINAATEKGWPATVCASPLGKLLYAHLKFGVIGTEVIQAEGEEDSFSTAVMVLCPEE